jgi:hypothetical protein
MSVKPRESRLLFPIYLSPSKRNSQNFTPPIIGKR